MCLRKLGSADSRLSNGDAWIGRCSADAGTVSPVS